MIMKYRNLESYTGQTVYLDTRGNVGYIGLVDSFLCEDYAATPDTVILKPAKMVVPRDNLNLREMLEHFGSSLRPESAAKQPELRTCLSGKAEIRIEDIISVFSIPGNVPPKNNNSERQNTLR